jgi:hypothetical protein
MPGRHIHAKNAVFLLEHYFRPKSFAAAREAFRTDKKLLNKATISTAPVNLQILQLRFKWYIMCYVVGPT